MEIRLDDIDEAHRWFDGFDTPAPTLFEAFPMEADGRRFARGGGPAERKSPWIAFHDFTALAGGFAWGSFERRASAQGRQGRVERFNAFKADNAEQDCIVGRLEVDAGKDFLAHASTSVGNNVCDLARIDPGIV
ncbi:hypothetical protein [Mesorhizobium sp. Root552]|uniref:hypothetical protein n=1 Tax=Mesorhizobium sp. Root552 TaxID=1736555 RepID=UPI001FCD5930|nr:hypothetical protein [Mesorhizobium sp. Root552]